MKSSEKRDEILRVAEEIFAEKDFRGCTMREIAERVGMQKPALYYYFKSKEDIYNSLIVDLYNKLKEKVREPVLKGRNLEEKISLLVNLLVDFWAEHPRFPRMIAHEVLSGGNLVYSELIPNFWVPMFTEVVKDLSGKPSEFEIGDVDIPLLLVNIFGMSVFYFFVGPILNTLSGEDSFTPEKIANLKKEIVNMVLDGIKRGNKAKV